jgi:hypothetical protein
LLPCKHYAWLSTGVGTGAAQIVAPVPRGQIRVVAADSGGSRKWLPTPIGGHVGDDRRAHGLRSGWRRHSTGGLVGSELVRASPGAGRGGGTPPLEITTQC